MDAALDRPRRERMAAVVDPAVIETCRPERRCPFAMTEHVRYRVVSVIPAEKVAEFIDLADDVGIIEVEPC
jgi:hypothetical protein